MNISYTDRAESKVLLMFLTRQGRQLIRLQKAFRSKTNLCKRQDKKYFPLRQSEVFNNITHGHTDRQTHRVTSWASCRRKK